MVNATATADLTAGRKNKRLEAAITTGIDDAITELAKELAGEANPKMFRSEAARQLLVSGIVARRRAK